MQKALLLQNAVYGTSNRVMLLLFTGKHHDLYRQRTVRQLLYRKQLQFHLFLSYLSNFRKLFYKNLINGLYVLLRKAFKPKKRQVNSFFRK